jgi:hypothetical protein
LLQGHSGLDKETANHFAGIVELAQSVFEQVEYEIDSTPERAIVRIQAQYGDYRIFVTELFDDTTRKYRYYVLSGNWVKAGFDNSPDPRAIRLKYGAIKEGHAGKYVPHLHTEDKTQLSLTEEMTFALFVTWLQDNT